MRRFAVVLVVLGLVLVGAGCGSDDSSDDGGADVGADADVDANADVDLDGGAFASKECQEVLEAMGSAASAAAPTAGGASADLEDSIEQFQAFAGKAPKEIRAEMSLLAEVYGEWAEVWADADYKAGSAPSPEVMQKMQEISEKYDSEELQAASDKVSDYFQNSCGK